MHPGGLALEHPTAGLLNKWSQLGCLTMTGWDWTIDEMEAAIHRGPHQLSMIQEAITYFAMEGEEKIALGQAWVVGWEAIWNSPPSH